MVSKGNIYPVNNMVLVKLLAYVFICADTGLKVVRACTSARTGENIEFHHPHPLQYFKLKHIFHPY